MPLDRARKAMRRAGGARKSLDKALALRGRLRGEVDIHGLVERGLTVGRNVYIAPWSIIDPGCAFMIEIGDDTVFGPRVHVLAHDASMRKALGLTRFAPVRIGARVFVGADTLVLPGTTIGSGSVIGAASVVSRDIPADVLAYGNPARPVGPVQEYFERQKKRIDSGPHFTVAEREDPTRWSYIRETVGDGEGWWP